ncbi:MAG: 4-phosphoerythronate dehydrogenase [Armatimonadetes bacterium]|nr:4-phosphoerythronate dehydrogenase [Armatimonadota bacterium]
MTIIADENIPFASAAFGQFGAVRLLPGRQISHGDLRDADALIVRSVTQVNSGLLGGTPVRFVGTATIGTEHLQHDWLRQQGLTVADAAGCNSRSVAEYLLAALLRLRRLGRLSIPGGTLGIIGMGRIGTLVADMAAILGLRVVPHDPPRAERERFQSATLAQALGCDAVTLHVPLVSNGDHPTVHLLEASRLAMLQPGSTLINTARGAVVELPELVAGLHQGLFHAIVDVWEGEPEIPVALARDSTIITPHIAGYSLEGKLRGTQMMADALAKFVGTANNWTMEEHLPPPPEPIVLLEPRAGMDAVEQAVRKAFDICVDDAAIRAVMGAGATERRNQFDALRKGYRARREFTAFTVTGAPATTAGLLASLGFGVG